MDKDDGQLDRDQLAMRGAHYHVEKVPDLKEFAALHRCVASG